MAIRDLPKYESDRDNYVHVDNAANFVQHMLKVDNCPEDLGADTETYHEPSMTAPTAIAKYINGAKNNCPFGVSLFDGVTGYWITERLDELAPLFVHPLIDLDFHNFKYDANMLLNIGIPLKETGIWDTAIMINLIDEEFMCKMPLQDGATEHRFKKSKALKNLGFHFLGADAHKYEDGVAEVRHIIAANTGRKVEEVSYKEVSDAVPLLMRDYAIYDTEATFRLKKIFQPMLQEQGLLDHTNLCNMSPYEIDIAASFAVIDIERAGFKIDTAQMAEDERQILHVISNTERCIYGVTGNKFNINSDAELVTEFEKLGQQWTWFTDKSELQTDKSVMKTLASGSNADVAALATEVLNYRKASKILSTYIIGIRDYIQEDGKVHPDFNICPNDYDRGGTVTGRLSSSNPNFQNLVKKPIRFDIEEEDL